MRKILTLIVALAMMVNTSNAAFTNATTETKQIASSKANLSAEQRAAAEFFVNLSRKDYEKLTGRHLGLTERLAFKMAQKSAKHQLKREAESDGFNFGGFALGFLLGLVGVLLAYIFSKDSNLRKWTWIGLGSFVVIYLLIVLLFVSGNH